jgi:hypothetical protein
LQKRLFWANGLPLLMPKVGFFWFLMLMHENNLWLILKTTQWGREDTYHQKKVMIMIFPLILGNLLTWMMGVTKRRKKKSILHKKYTTQRRMKKVVITIILMHTLRCSAAAAASAVPPAASSAQAAATQRAFWGKKGVDYAMDVM